MTDATPSSAAAGLAHQSPPFQVGPNNCEREPIHIPGSIQPHGCLLAFEPGTGWVLHSYSNLSNWLPASPAAPAPALPEAAAKALDWQRFAALVEDIIPLLEDSKFDALNRYKAIKSLVKGTELAAEIEDIGSILATFNFASALARLRTLASGQPDHRTLT